MPDETYDDDFDPDAEEAAVEAFLEAVADEQNSPEPEVLVLEGLDVPDEKVLDLPSTLADSTLSDVDPDDLDGIEDIEDPQEQLEAYRQAGFPDSLLEVTSGADGRIVRVVPLVGNQRN